MVVPEQKGAFQNSGLFQYAEELFKSLESFTVW